MSRETEFDKRTALGVRDRFPAATVGETLLSERIIKALCAKLAEQVLACLPRLSDYLCPVCAKVAFQPIRLNCNHVLCMPCMVAMQRTRSEFCPICGNAGILIADFCVFPFLPSLMFFAKRADFSLLMLTLYLLDNLDLDLWYHLCWYFRAEVRAKQRVNEKAVVENYLGKTMTRCVPM